MCGHQTPYPALLPKVVSFINESASVKMGETQGMHRYPLHLAVGGHVNFRHWWIWGFAPTGKDAEGTMQPQASSQALDLLMKQRPDAIKQADQQGLLPIHCAAFYNNVDAVRRLLAHDRSLAWEQVKSQGKRQPYEGCLPIHWAAFGGAEAVCDELLALDPTLRTAQGAYEGNYENWENGKGSCIEP
jgi:hypothetical protein